MEYDGTSLIGAQWLSMEYDGTSPIGAQWLSMEYHGASLIGAQWLNMQHDGTSPIGVQWLSMEYGVTRALQLTKKIGFFHGIPFKLTRRPLSLSRAPCSSRSRRLAAWSSFEPRWCGPRLRFRVAAASELVGP